MKKPDESFDNSAKDAQTNHMDSNKLLSGFDERRRTFLKKLLITTAYVTPAILSFSIGDLEAGRRRRKKPTRKAKKKKQRKKKKKW